MSMQRWTPTWRPFEDIERMMESPRVWWRTPPEDMGWAPAVDVYEKEDSFIVRAELPGVKMEDIEISMSGDTLTIKGERKTPADVKEEEFECCEVCYGPFSRSITLTEAVQADKIEATLESGILEIKLRKSEEAKTHKISIKAKQ